MSDATLTARDALEHGPGWRLLEVDCVHGRTTSAYKNAPGGAQLGDAAVIRAMLIRHDDAERCRCTRALRRRYGLTR